jgi:hypothetical protein
VAVLVRGYNEESAVAKVVADFRSALPTAAVYVYDNNSTDKTAEVVRAVVRREIYQGKGHVVRRMFNDVEAERPLSLFGAFGIALAIAAIGFAIPIFIACVQEVLVLRLPTAALSTGLTLLAFLSITAGLILDTVTRGCHELKLLAYLALPAPGEGRRS